jgi:hypothetical protein
VACAGRNVKERFPKHATLIPVFCCAVGFLSVRRAYGVVWPFEAPREKGERGRGYEKPQYYERWWWRGGGYVTCSCAVPLVLYYGPKILSPCLLHIIWKVSLYSEPSPVRVTEEEAVAQIKG